MATRHLHPPHTRDEQLLVDCDLAVLGQSRERFDAYELAIRNEYTWVIDADYRAGRTKVLEQFQSRNAIYSLPAFRNRYEAAARSNLAHSLQRLKAKS
jgi:predicted metal-dependent HD superfamily phosphohydrolase